MSRYSKRIPDYKRLLKKNVQLKLKYGLILIGVLLFDGFSIVHFYSADNQTLAVMGSIGILLSLFFTLAYFYAFLDKKPQTLAEYPGDNIGNYSKQDVTALLNRLFDENIHGEVPQIYLLDDKLGSPCTIDTYLFNWRRNVNAIYLPEYVFYILKHDELKAVILHELGHFKKYMLPTHRLPFAFTFFVFLAPVYLYYLLAAHYFFPAYAVAALILFINQKRMMSKPLKVHEYLADFYAAQRVGILPVINGLLAVVQYGEMMQFLGQHILKHIRKERRLSVKVYSTLLKDIAAALPPGIASKRRVSSALKAYWTSDRGREYFTELSNAQVAKESQIIDRTLSFNFMADDVPMADWSDFDRYKRNRRIEVEEYDDFMQYLLENTEKALFKDVNEDRVSALLEGSHPLLRNRLLFLHQNRHYLTSSE